MNKKTKILHNINLIALNKNIQYKYYIENEFKAGIVLKGWEVKSLRAGKVNINNSYIILKNYEVYWFGAILIPLSVAFLHDICESKRTRKLLLNKRELKTLYGSVSRKGYTLVPISLFWEKAWCKIKIGLAKGKKQYDKRIELKKRNWQLDKARILKKIKY